MSLSSSDIESMRDRLRQAITAGDKAQGLELARQALAAQVAPLMSTTEVDPCLIISASSAAARVTPVSGVKPSPRLPR